MTEYITTKTVGRTGTYVPHYLRIANEHYKYFEHTMAEIEKMESAHLEISQKLRYAEFSHGQIVIVFMWMCLESLSYDYAAMHFSDSYVQKYLEKLPTMSKLILVPQLVTGQRFPTDGQAYQYLDELKTCRNELVHCQSGPVAKTDAEKKRDAETILKNVKEFPQKVRHAQRCIALYADTVIKMHGDKEHFLDLLLDFIEKS